jgi:hypothetical protein
MGLTGTTMPPAFHAPSRAEQGKHELRDVLQHDRQPIAAPETLGQEVDRDAVGKPVDLTVAQPAVEVRDRRQLRITLDAAPKGTQWAQCRHPPPVRTDQSV